MDGQGNNPPNGAAPDASGQDACSSVFAMLIDQRQSMERLLNWIRQSQTTCTDTQCSDALEEFGGYQSPLLMRPSSEFSFSIDSHLVLVAGFIMAMIALYFMSLRQNSNSRTKSNHFDGPPASGGGNPQNSPTA